MNLNELCFQSPLSVGCVKQRHSAAVNQPMNSSIESLLSTHVADFLGRHHAIEHKIAVALSGGIDSMVLLDILHTLNLSKAAPSLVFEAIHVNHNISPNAQHWAAFCVAECEKRSLPITVESVTVDRNSGAGLEAAARAARYAALAKSSARFILTAQHQDDQAETVLHQLLRGTGLNGLAGMGESRALSTSQTLLRPLLKITRAQIESYAAGRDLQWIEDESNNDTRHTRNFLRHEVIPVIAARFPHYADSLARTAQHAAESAELNEALAMLDLQWNGRDAFADALDALPMARQCNALYYWLRWQNVALPSHAQLETWAGQIFRDAPESKPHQAGGHDFLICRKQGKLILKTDGAS